MYYRDLRNVACQIFLVMYLRLRCGSWREAICSRMFMWLDVNDRSTCAAHLPATFVSAWLTHIARHTNAAVIARKYTLVWRRMQRRRSNFPHRVLPTLQDAPKSSFLCDLLLITRQRFKILHLRENFSFCFNRNLVSAITIVTPLWCNWYVYCINFSCNCR